MLVFGSAEKRVQGMAEFMKQDLNFRMREQCLASTIGRKVHDECHHGVLVGACRRDPGLTPAADSEVRRVAV